MSKSLSVAQLAQRWHCQERAVRDLIEEKRLTCAGVGKIVRIHMSEILRYEQDNGISHRLRLVTDAELKRRAKEPVNLDKIEAAQRQLDCSIRLFFDREDAVSIHSLSAAAYRILRDIAEETGQSGVYQKMMDRVKPGMHGLWWQYVNKSANWFKHADDDHEENYQFNPEQNDSNILMAVMLYMDLGYPATPEMQAFQCYAILKFPSLFKPIPGTEAMQEQAQQSFQILSLENQFAPFKKMIKDLRYRGLDAKKA